jgi:hypothetical protein
MTNSLPQTTPGDPIPISVEALLVEVLPVRSLVGVLRLNLFCLVVFSHYLAV